jgi:hypothetical protein
MVYHWEDEVGKSFCRGLPRRVAPSSIHNVMLLLKKTVPVRKVPGGR